MEAGLASRIDELITLIRCLLKPYKIITRFEVVVRDKDIFAECNSISFENQGDVDVFIDGKYLLKAGDPTFIIPTQIPHTDITTYKITFDKASTGTSPKLIVIKKILSGQ
jgi:hypothetical protein